MRRYFLLLAIFLATHSGVSADPLPLSVLRTALDRANHQIVSGVLIQLNDESDLTYELGEAIFITSPNYQTSDLADDADLILSFEDAAVVGDAVLCRDESTGIVYSVMLDDILFVNPVITNSSAFRRFTEKLGSR